MIPPIIAPPASVNTTDADNITSGTLNGARLPNPQNDVLGGVLSSSAVSGQFVTNISTSGQPVLGIVNLSVLADVQVTEGSGINGYTLNWNNGAGKWEAVAPVTPITTLSGLSDVQVTEGSGINGYALTWNNSAGKWEATGGGGLGSITLGSTAMALGDTYNTIAGEITWTGQQDTTGNISLAYTSWLYLNGTTDVNWRIGLGINAYTTVHVTESKAVQFVHGSGSGGGVYDGWSVGTTSGNSIIETVGATQTAYITGSGGLQIDTVLTLGGSANLSNFPLEKLTDVTITSPASGQVLTWNGSDWVNEAIGSGSLAALTDVSVTEGSGINGYTLNWNNGAGKWEAVAPVTGVTTLAALTDVSESSPANNQQLLYQSSTSKWTNENVPVVIGVSITGTMTASETLMIFVAPLALELPAGLTGSYATATQAATASTTCTLYKNGTSIGTAVWSASGTSATFTFASAVSFAAGDVLTVVAPSSADASLANIGITLNGYRI